METRLKNVFLMWIPVVIATAIAFVIYWFLIYRKSGVFTGLMPGEISGMDSLLCLAAFACSIAIMFIFLKLVPMEKMYDENVRMLADSFDMKFLTVFFIPNAFYEEVIFRGALQPVFGIIPAAILFTVVHVSYLKKPIMLVEVFCQAMVLGTLYKLTGSVWITTIAHAAYNTIQTWLIQTDRIHYRLD